MRRGVLSIKATRPKEVRLARYDDLAVNADDGVFHYRFQGTDPANRDNVAMREAFEDKTPLVYLYGVTPGVYQALLPVFITSWDADRLTAEVSVQSQPSLIKPLSLEAIKLIRPPLERRYATVEAKVRLHQAAFRMQVVDAYKHACAVCGFPRDELLDAAHIVAGHDERGRPEVPNGLCLCHMHHGGFDANMFGIRPDGVIEIGRVLKETRDGPTLEHGYLAFDGKTLRVPLDTEDKPKREYLEERYAAFKAAS